MSQSHLATPSSNVNKTFSTSRLAHLYAHSEAYCLYYNIYLFNGNARAIGGRLQYGYTMQYNSNKISMLNTKLLKK